MHFHVVVVQKRAKKCTKERDARAKLLLFCFFDVLFAVAVVVAKAPYYWGGRECKQTWQKAMWNV